MNRTPRILIVEDERVVAEDIHRSLKSIGYDIAATASSGLDACKLARSLEPDLVLMDIVIDGHMNGIDTARRLRNELDLPVVYLTAYTDKDTLEQAKLTEPFGYLLKPFDDRELQTTIEMALYKHLMERRLRESEARLKSVQDSNPAGILIIEKENRIVVDANTAAVKMIGGKRDEIIGSWCGDFLNLNDDRFCHDLLEEKDRKEAEATLRGFDGVSLPVYLHAVPLIFEGQEHVLVSFIDLTERKRAEAALMQSEERYRGLFETMAQGVLYHNSKRKIVAGNPAAEQILGISIDRLIGGTLFDHSWGSVREDNSKISKEDHPIVVCFHKGEPIYEEVLGIITPEGERRWLLMGV